MYLLNNLQRVAGCSAAAGGIAWAVHNGVVDQSTIADAQHYVVVLADLLPEILRHAIKLANELAEPNGNRFALFFIAGLAAMCSR